MEIIAENRSVVHEEATVLMIKANNWVTSTAASKLTRSIARPYRRASRRQSSELRTQTELGLSALGWSLCSLSGSVHQAFLVRCSRSGQVLVVGALARDQLFSISWRPGHVAVV